MAELAQYAKKNADVLCDWVLEVSNLSFAAFLRSVIMLLVAGIQIL